MGNFENMFFNNFNDTYPYMEELFKGLLLVKNEGDIVCPLTFLGRKSDGTYERYSSKARFNYLNPYCEAYIEHFEMNDANGKYECKTCNENGRVHCYYQDEFVAEAIYKCFISGNINKATTYFNNKEEYKTIKPIVLPYDYQKDKIPFCLRYQCAGMGFVEFAVPYIINDTFFGVFFSGQFHTDKNSGHYNVMKEHLKAYYMNKNKVIPREDSPIYDKQKLDKARCLLIDSINGANGIMEVTESLMEHYYINRFNDVQSSLVEMLSPTRYDNEKNEDNEKTDFEIYSDKLNSLIERIGNAAKELCKIFEFNSIAVYVKDVVDPAENIDTYDDKTTVLKPRLYNSSGKSEINSDFFKPLKIKKYNWIDFPQSNDILEWIHLEMHYMEFPIAFCIDYGDGKLNGENKAKLIKMLEVLGNCICSEGSDILSSFNSKRLRSFTNHMRHEISQKASGMRVWQKEMDISSANYFKVNWDSPHISGYAKRIKDYMDDVESFTENISIRLASTRYLDGLPPIEPTYFYPYKEFLFRWSRVFENECWRRGIKFDFPDDIKSSDKNRPLMFGDIAQIEQIVYNLTLNAIKYAFRNTRVSLDCHLNKNRTKYLLKVTNYGIRIPEEDRELIFTYQGRSKNTLNREGEGLGLYFSRLIARAHKGDILLEQQDISRFNVPLISEYVKMTKLKDAELEKELAAERERLKYENILNDILGDDFNASSLSSLYIMHNIMKPTSRITFILELPYKK